MNEKKMIQRVPEALKCFRKRYIIFAVMLLSVLSIPTQNADVNVTGAVVAESNGEPLIGVSIFAKNGKQGSVTDIDGTFSIKVKAGDVLKISYLGYITQEVKVTGKPLKIKLAEDNKALNEVVVIGYGTAKRKDVTGSISSISGDEIKKSQPVTIEQALQGKIPGMVVQQISGQPGGAVSVQINGLSSFGASGPLWIVDGIRMNGAAAGTAYLGNGTNPLAGINPSDIESIDVLKDASATAIYGSEATNGVIVITTKKGKAGAPTITYDFYTGYQQLISKAPVMNLQEYATFMNERNAGIGWGFDTRPEFANPQYLGKGTDWQAVLFRNAPMTSHALSIRGGDNRTTYALSASYLKQEGIALGSDFKRTTIHLNLDNKTTDWLKIGTDINLVNIKDNVNSTSSNVIMTALTQTPDIAVQNSDGSWGGSYNTAGWVDQVANPYALALINKDQADRYQIFGSAYAEIQFSKHLSLRNDLTGSFSMATEDQYYPSYKMGAKTNNINKANYLFSESTNARISNYITYRNLFKEKYNMELMVAHEASVNYGEGTSAYRENFPSDNIRNISSGDATTAKNSGDKSQGALEAYFGRLFISISDKYLCYINVRNDGSSKYNSANRWVTTYSVGPAWRISNEKFLKGIKSINDLKLRLGYGLTNNPVGREYAYATTLKTVANSISGIGQITSALGNPNLKWEKTKYTSIGLDATLFNSRIDFTVDLYNRRTDGLGMQTYLPYYSATAIGWSPGTMDAPYVNIGSVSNKGFNFRISTKNITGKNFSWSTDFTGTHNVNKVLKINAKDAAIYGISNNGLSITKTIEGRPIGDFYGYVFDGIFAKPSDFLGDRKNGIEAHARPVRNGEELPVGTSAGSIWYGDRKFKDLNGDGIIDERDQTFLGSPRPKFVFGLNNTFSYKGFDLNVYFSANYGSKVFNQLRLEKENPISHAGLFNSLMDYAKLGMYNPSGSSTDVNNVYVTNPDTRIVGMRNDDTNGNKRVSDIYVENGSFIKCKTIALGYTLPEKLFQKTPIKSARVYANVTNVFIISKYKGMDPEIGSWDPTTAGIDYGYYPQPRVITFGLNISLNK